MKKLTNKSKNIILIGPMGAGKTMVGQRLAEILEKVFYDADRELEKQAKTSITNIFQKEGEAKFREYESQIIAKLTSLDNIILATGGGAVLMGENRLCLSSNGLVVYLKVSIAEQLHRLKDSHNRPLLQTKDPEATLKMLAQQRESYYHDLADHVVMTDHKSVDTIAYEIARFSKG